MYDNYYQQNPKLSGLFDSLFQNLPNLINSAVTVKSLFNTTGGTTSGGQAKGLEAITQTGNQLMQQLQALRAQIGQQPYQQIVDTANAIVAAFSNPTYFYQAKNGDDAAALQNFKTQSAALARQIITEAGQVSGVTAIGNQTSQVISSAGNTTTTGLDTVANLFNNPIVIYGGLAVLAYYLLRK
jgi:predicted NBD/HSP70 family sugar kinase